MQWPPKNRHFARLQFLQLHSNRVQVSQSGVILSSVSNHRFADIEVSILSVKGAGSQLSAKGREPMPEKVDNALAVGLLVPIDGFADCAVVVGRPIVPRIVGGVVLHVEALDNGFESCLSDEIFIVECGLAGEDILVIVVYEILVKFLGLGRSIGIDQLVEAAGQKHQADEDENPLHIEFYL